MKNVNNVVNIYAFVEMGTLSEILTSGYRKYQFSGIQWSSNEQNNSMYHGRPYWGDSIADCIFGHAGSAEIQGSSRFPHGEYLKLNPQEQSPNGQNLQADQHDQPIVCKMPDIPQNKGKKVMDIFESGYPVWIIHGLSDNVMLRGQSYHSARKSCQGFAWYI